MIPTESERYRRVARCPGSRSVLVGMVVIALLLLAPVVTGCGSALSEAVGTPAPTAAASAADPASVWPSVGAGQEPLFDLVVTEAQGFTVAERDYLRSERVAWSRISGEAAAYAALGAGGDPATATRLLARIGRRAERARSAPSPSPRFQVLRENVRRLMGRVTALARTGQAYQDAADADKTALAARLARIASPLSAQAFLVSDWGVDLYFRYGRVVSGPYYVATATTTTATATVAATEAPTPSSSSGSSPRPEPEPRPKPSMTAAEAKQVEALAELNTWLTPVVDDALALVAAQQLPWSDEEVESFCLNMSYLRDQGDTWLAKPSAGALVTPGFNEYKKGLSLVRRGAEQLDAAARSDDAAHQKALDKGAQTLENAVPYLKAGMSRLEALD